MSISLKTETINLNELVKNEKNMILAESDVIVPDVCPDIKEVLTVSARPAIARIDPLGGKVTISGTIAVNILYVPEKTDENTPELKSIDTKFDFSDVFDCGCENPQLSVDVDTENIAYNLLNSRKLNVKITCAISIKSYSPTSYEFPISSEDENIEMQKKTVSLCNMVSDTQKDFSFSETIDLPAAKTDIEEILKTDVKIIKGECKFSEGKILLRGSLIISTLYLGFEDGCITEYMEHELPFGEIIESDIPTDNCMCNIIYNIKEVTAAVKNDINGDPRSIDISMIICANITSSSSFEVDIIDDCYLPGMQCSLKKETKLLKKCVNEGTSKISHKAHLTLPEKSAPILKVMNTNLIPKIRKTSTADNKLTLSGDITAVILYKETTEKGAFRSLIREIPFEHEVDIDDITKTMSIDCSVAMMGTSYNIVGDTEIELRSNLEFYIRVTDTQPTDIITECNIKEMAEDEKNTPHLIIYFTSPGDTLWNIAKKYNTTVKKISDANNISAEITAGQKILIPSK